jgi:hypothetical protein
MPFFFTTRCASVKEKRQQGQQEAQAVPYHVCYSPSTFCLFAVSSLAVPVVVGSFTGHISYPVQDGCPLLFSFNASTLPFFFNCSSGSTLPFFHNCSTASFFLQHGCLPLFKGSTVQRFLCCENGCPSRSGLTVSFNGVKGPTPFNKFASALHSSTRQRLLYCSQG